MFLPFNLQISYLHAYQPIFILHFTRKKDWVLIINSQCAIGWIKSDDIAFVDSEFIRKWKNNQYITPLNDDIGESKGFDFTPSEEEAMYQLAKQIGVRD